MHSQMLLQPGAGSLALPHTRARRRAPAAPQQHAGASPPHQRCCRLVGASPSSVPSIAAAAASSPAAGGGSQRRASRRVRCDSAASFVQDSADVVPDAYDSDDDEEAWQPANTPVLVVGAGPVGLLAAMYLARRGHPVKIIDKQRDPIAAELLGGSAAPASAQQQPPPDVPLVLSSRCLLAFEELGAKELLQGLLAPSLKGTWWVNGPPPGHHLHAPSAAAAASATAPHARAVLEQYPGWSDRYTRRVLVRRSQLVRALLLEAERLYGDKIELYWESEFVRTDWDQRQALVNTHTDTDGGAEAQAGGQAAALNGSAASPDPLLPELAAAAGVREVRVPFALLVGADGADSSVRGALERKRPKITDFSVQRPLCLTSTYKFFDALPQVPSSGVEAVPGLASHGEREYEYRWACAQGSAPSLRMWVPAQGLVCGVIESADDGWDAQQLEERLRQAYGSSLPDEWRQLIVKQTCGPDAPPALSHSSTVQCAQFHGPRTVLLGDAAHAMTQEYDQGVSCAVEGVRLLNIALKSAHGNLDKALNLYSEVRCEDVHSVQQLEFFQTMSSAAARGGGAVSGLQHADWVHRVAGALAALVWQAARVVMQLATQYMPSRFPASYVTDRLWDARRGYSDLLKVVLRFAAVPILLAIAAAVVAGRAALQAIGPHLPGARWFT